MPRATSAPARNKRKKKIFKAAKGYFGGRKNLYRTAKDAVEKGNTAFPCACSWSFCKTTWRRAADSLLIGRKRTFLYPSLS